MSDNFWNQFDEAVAEESKGSGGILALTTVEAGYKVYVGNRELQDFPRSKGQPELTQADTFFPAGPDKASRAKAKAEAVAFAQALGKKEPTSLSIRMTCQRDGALSKGQPVTWNNDREFVEGIWKNKAGEESDGMKVVAPALRAIGLDLPWTCWARIGFAPSPSGRQDKDSEGNPRVAQVAYPVQVYESEAAAKAEAVIPASSNGFNAADYASDKAHMQAMFDTARKEKKAPAVAYDEVAKAYELTPEQVKQVLAL